ncbi:MAG: hypothetical protein ABIP55_03045 [Tepidisphaeraceae bacterium]
MTVLVKAVPGILKSQDKQTGRFGSGIWIVQDQHAMYALAVAWGSEGKDNPHYHSPEVLEAIMSAGDALIADMDPQGMWEFRKKDGSTWGQTYMPWTWSRWIRAYAIVRDAMPADRRAKWDKAMTLGFDGIAATETKKPMQNIPVHNCMGLYLASKVFNRADWEKAAVDYIHACVDAQHPDGYWTEHKGPVVVYNGVYVDALGAYYGMSGDKKVLDALVRSSHFHSAMVYPDGRAVETVDERNPYNENIVGINIGFCFSPQGRAHVKRQIERMAKYTDNPVGWDGAASFILYGEEGELAPPPKSGDVYVSGDKQVTTRRQGPWFACLTSYTAELDPRRWIQDRQNFLSLYRDDFHVILGGGNTKLQPLWSTFTVGDVSLLKHTPGDESPNFFPPAGKLLHTPSDATLDPENARLELDYNGTKCAVRIDLSDPDKAKVVYSLLSPSVKDVAAHVPLLPKLKETWATASGKSGTLSEEPITLGPGEAGAWFEHRGFRVTLPPQASITWPALPHNPYAKDGKPALADGRIVITLPFSSEQTKQEIAIGVEVEVEAQR